MTTIQNPPNLNQSPTIEEMERMLGINPDSPMSGGLLFCGPQPQMPTAVPAGERKKSRRSTRRTSVFGSELEQSLQFIRNATAAKNLRARRMSDRPQRAAAQGIFYGSPSGRSKIEENKENDIGDEQVQVQSGAAAMQHPLLNQNAFTGIIQYFIKLPMN